MNDKLEALERAIDALPSPPSGWPDEHAIRSEFYATLVGALSVHVADSTWDTCLSIAGAFIHRQYGGVTA